MIVYSHTAPLRAVHALRGLKCFRGGRRCCLTGWCSVCHLPQGQRVKWFRQDIFPLLVLLIICKDGHPIARHFCVINKHLLRTLWIMSSTTDPQMVGRNHLVKVWLISMGHFAGRCHCLEEPKSIFLH